VALVGWKWMVGVSLDSLDQDASNGANFMVIGDVLREL
jgi:hypothetical protein